METNDGATTRFPRKAQLEIQLDVVYTELRPSSDCAQPAKVVHHAAEASGPMGNSYSTVPVKDVDTRPFSPRGIRDVGEAVAAEDVVIFNCGFREKLAGFGQQDVVATLTLRAEGYKDQEVTAPSSAPGMLDSVVRKGFTFTLDKKCLPSATLTLNVKQGSATVGEQHIPVRKY